MDIYLEYQKVSIRKSKPGFTTTIKPAANNFIANAPSDFTFTDISNENYFSLVFLIDSKLNKIKMHYTTKLILKRESLIKYQDHFPVFLNNYKNIF